MTYTLTSHWLPASQYPLKAPYAMTPEGIVVHNTAGTASAREEAAAMIASTAATSFHVVIDEAEAVECIPFARNAWHAGDGAAGYANRHLIGLEIARSMDTASDRFDQAEANAALYIAHVCRQYGWTSAQLHQHNWYSSTACPHRTKTHWQTFLTQVDEYIAALESGGVTDANSGGAGAQNDGAESAAGANGGGASEGGAGGANSEGTGAGGTGDAGAQNDGGGSTAGAGDAGTRNDGAESTASAGASGGGTSGAGGAGEGAGSTAGANNEGAGEGGAGGANSGGAGEGGAGGANSGGAGSDAGAGDGGTSGNGGASGGAGSTAGANGGGASAETAAGTNADAQTITILCDGHPLILRGRNENGTIYTSLRDLATGLGHTVRWENGMAVVEK